jgi:DNA-binding NarL/FixJ family response regulator
MRHSQSLAYEMATKSNDRVPSIRDLLIIEDHPLMGEVLSIILKIEFGLRSVRTEGGLELAVEALRRGLTPDLILLDLRLPDCSGVEGIVTLRKQAPETPIVIVSADTNHGMVAAALAAGARGYISKQLCRDELCFELRRAINGELVTPEGFDPHSLNQNDHRSRAELADRFATLTPQQMRILRMICMGLANKEISYELSIVEATVKTHVNAIMSKINVRRRTQIVRLANEAGLFDLGAFQG